MKRSLQLVACLFFLLLSLQCRQNDKHKENRRWVYDYEGVLNPKQIASFDSLFAAHEKKTSNEIVLVSTADYRPDTSLLLYAVNFGRRYGVGKEKKNNGVVLAFSKAHREVRITTGYGTERVLDDLKAKYIVDSIMIPHFKKGQFFEGLWAGSNSIVTFLEKPENKIE